MSAAMRTPTLPFAHLNLRRNPFGEFSVAERMALADVDVAEFDTFLGDPSSVLQFVGEKGYGKTTHLLALHARWEGSGYVHIPEGEQARVPQGNPLLIDEAQRLTWRQQRSVFQARIPLVLGTHYDFCESLRRAGRQVRTVAVERTMSPERLTRILNSRIHSVRRHDGAVPSIRLETASQLLEQFGPNIRRVQHELYLIIQNMNRIQDV